MSRAVLAAAVALALVSGAMAQTPQPTTPAQEEASLHGFGEANKACREWTDGCRTCTRPEGGEPVCSNIGIACQPTTISCISRVDEKKAEEKK